MFLRKSSARLTQATPRIIGLFTLQRTFAQKTYTANIEAYFTPDHDCKKIIIDEIKKAKTSIHLQAYIFTCRSIANAISEAKRNGIDVQVILDKNQFDGYQHSCSKFLTENQIPTWSDYKPAIAHSKIIIIDKSIVLTGSYNLTYSAQQRNTENLLVIRDRELADFYFDHWEKRQSLSQRKF